MYIEVFVGLKFDDSQAFLSDKVEPDLLLINLNILNLTASTCKTLE